MIAFFCYWKVLKDSAKQNYETLPLDFLEKLEDDDDVQNVYANLKVDNNFMEKIST